MDIVTGGSKPSLPPLPPPIPIQAPAPAAKSPNTATQQTNRAKALAAIGPSGSVMTGPQGLMTPAQTTKKSLTGQ